MMHRSVPILLALALFALAACEQTAKDDTPAEPDRAAARVRMARTLLRQGHVDEALEQLRRLPPDAEHSVGPLSQPEWFEPVLRQLIMRRALDEAESLLALTGPLDTRSASLKAITANLIVLRGDLERAIATWASIRSSDPDMQVQVHHELATLYLMAGRPTEAETQAREGLAVQPDHWQLRALLGEALLAQDRTDESLEEVRRLEPGVARWQLEARVELEGFGRAKRAVALLGQAHQAAPRNPDIRLQLARAHVAAGALPQARLILEPLVNIPVPFEGSREALLEVYEGLGETRLAGKLREELDEEARLTRARELRVSGLQASMAGDLDHALAEFERALEIDPADANLHNDRGAVLARMARYDEAEVSFLRAEELAPEDPVVQENLARLYQKTGDEERRDAAIARWQELTAGQAPQPE